jgi:ribosomal protein S18 acetylase RimI-like enzyme
MIEVGKIEKCPSASGAGKFAFEMRTLEKSDLPQIMALQNVILGRLSRKDLLEAFSRQFMESHIGAKGFILGIFVQNELIAFRNVYFPGLNDREWNLGYDIGLKAPEDLKRVANLQMICVHPRYRGNSLGRQLNLHAIDTIRRLGRYTHLCATVSPYNYWNIRILLKCGFTIRTLKDKYNGKLRYVVYQNLTLTAGDLEQNDCVSVRLTDVERQKALIHRGFIGIGIREIDGFRPQGRMDLANGFEVIFSAMSSADAPSGRPPAPASVTNKGSDSPA